MSGLLNGCKCALGAPQPPVDVGCNGSGCVNTDSGQADSGRDNSGEEDGEEGHQLCQQSFTSMHFMVCKFER